MFKMNKEKISELFCYAFFGATGTIINVLIFYFFAQNLSVHYMLSNLIAWIFSVAFAFVTNKIWVFKSSSWAFSLWLKECLQFVFARIATCVFDMGYMFLAVSIFGWNKTVSKIIANIIVIIANYILSKMWIFRKKENSVIENSQSNSDS